MIELNKIYNEDCLEGMKRIPDKSIDLVVTSPPYNKNKVGGKITRSITYGDYDDSLDEDIYQEWQVSILNEIYRLLKDGGSVFYNHKNRYVDGKLISPFSWLTKTNFNIRQEIVWDRGIASNIRGWRFWQVDERIYWLQKRLL